MNVMNRRSRMVSFRLSEQEYESLMEICAVRGSRSLSDLARDAMQRLIAAPAAEGPLLEVEVQRLNGQLEQLDREVRRLALIVNGAPANAGGKA